MKITMKILMKILILVILLTGCSSYEYQTATSTSPYLTTESGRINSGKIQIYLEYSRPNRYIALVDDGSNCRLPAITEMDEVVYFYSNMNLQKYLLSKGWNYVDVKTIYINNNTYTYFIFEK